jgi:tetratricopeptide (TPR) repeat protein
LYSERRFRESIEEHRHALRINDSLPADPVRTGRAHNDLGIALMDANEVDQAREELLRALSLLEEALGSAHPIAGRVLFNLGVLATDRGRSGEAREYFARSLAVAEQGGGDAQVAICASSLGHTMSLLGEYEQARQYLQRALSAAASAASYPPCRLARLYVNLGQLERFEGHYSAAERDYEHASALAGSCSESTDALVGLGRAYLAESDAARALPVLERAVARREAERDTDPPELAEVRLALAQALWQTGRDRSRGHALAQQARDFYRIDPSREAEVGDLEQWIDRHGVLADHAGGAERSASPLRPPSSTR